MDAKLELFQYKHNALMFYGNAKGFLETFVSWYSWESILEAYHSLF